jgi:hypothetical protein
VIRPHLAPALPRSLMALFIFVVLGGGSSLSFSQAASQKEDGSTASKKTLQKFSELPDFQTVYLMRNRYGNTVTLKTSENIRTLRVEGDLCHMEATLSTDIEPAEKEQAWVFVLTKYSKLPENDAICKPEGKGSLTIQKVPKSRVLRGSYWPGAFVWEVHPVPFDIW